MTSVYSLLLNFDPAVLKTQIATQPGTYSRVLNALCKLTESSLKCQRLGLDKVDDATLSPLLSSVPPTKDPAKSR